MHNLFGAAPVFRDIQHIPACFIHFSCHKIYNAQ